MTAAEQQQFLARAEYLRSLEKSFAFERASGVIESECILADYDGDDFEYIDLDTASMDLSQEIEYLKSRGLLLYHPDHANWVTICDEDEPCNPEAQPASDSGGYLQQSLDLLKRSGEESVLNQRVIEIHEIAERILAEAVHRWCHANNLTQYTVDQILRDARVRAIAEWEKKTNKRFEVLP